MVVPCTAQVGLLLWILLRRSQMMVASDHPPIQEGKSLIFTCSGRSESTQRRSLYWKTTDRSGDTVNQATCHSTESRCRNYNHKFEAIATFTDTSYTTSFTIRTIPNPAPFLAINCTLYEVERDSSYDIESWNMLNLEYPPENPVCTADYNVEDTTVTITCSAPQVFPRVVCKFFEVRDNGAEVPITTPEIKYSYPESSSAVSRCSMVKGISKPGIFKYKVDLYPGMTDGDLFKKPATTVYTNEISVAGKPEVNIQMISECKHNKRQQFLCTSRWLPSQANLTWFKNTTLIRSTTTTSRVDSGFYVSQSSVELENMNSYVGPINCQADYVTDVWAGKKTIRAQLLVNTSVSSLYFTYNGIPLGNKLFLEEGTTPGKFECRVINGSKPPINAVEVVCKVSGKAHNVSLVAESVAFQLPPVTSTDVGICYCSVTRNSGCDKPTVNFTFSFLHAEYSRSTFPRLWSENYTHSIYYITAGCIGLILLVFILGTVMFLVRKWDKLYTYVYGKLYASTSSHGQSRAANGGHWYYSVANSVESRLPGGETSLTTEICVTGGDRTFMAPSPSSCHSQHVYCNVDVDSDEEDTNCTDWRGALYPPMAERNEYSNRTNDIFPKPAATQPMSASEAMHTIICNRLFEPSDLVENPLHTYNNTKPPPKPCKFHNCPDLLRHRPSLDAQVSSSDDDDDDVQLYHTIGETVATEEYVAGF